MQALHVHGDQVTVVPQLVYLFQYYCSSRCHTQLSLANTAVIAQDALSFENKNNLLNP